MRAAQRHARQGRPPVGSGLSTEDLVQPCGRADRTEGETAPTQAEAPTFPGESTPAPSSEGAEPQVEESRAEERRKPAAEEGDETPQLLGTEGQEGFRARWEKIQSKFVDDPGDPVHAADALVAEVMQTLATTFAEHKQELEGQWNRGERADTEDLRLALRHYRSFFNRLLSA
ncbi:hypothetical protein [Streptomyces brasiliensis]|uniref:Uncharacterized protein n=1 Tax=Streptomyces brasiliensis TaxID=1954 RepID=A0A917KVV8_9ACTN|nr:hypothetical protein [Streptomyces brasiliensis]GGJ28438.1 hypothetical protein GCM10010121_044730 [Streptomyces brasiliensis]